ncbi:hypothetical protein AB0E69_13640 [Kribbella sp. NPDC026611]|uniref:hypothetical protein n=1 Tax=Kribbella sp. NPDC026611 TaxID=3154911 RepID=UPI0033E6F6F9
MTTPRTSRRTVLTGLATLAAAPLVAGRVTTSRALAASARAAGAWTVYDFPHRDEPTLEQRVEGIYAASATDAWSIGRAGVQPVVGRWDGSRWRVVPAPAVGGDIAGTAADDIWIGTGSANMHWDGSAWTVLPVPPPPSDQLYVSTGNLVSDARGTAWSTTATESIYGAGPLQYRIMRWVSGQWQVVPNPPQTNLGYELLDLDVAGAASTWVVGTRTAANRTLVAQWNGDGWVDHTMPVSAGSYVYPDAVVALAPNDVWITGREGERGYLAHWDGSAWTRLAVPTGGWGSQLYDVGGSVLLKTQAWYGGGRDGLFRWTGSGWSELPKPAIRVFFTEVRSTFSAAPGGGVWVAGGRTDGDHVVPSTALYR